MSVSFSSVLPGTYRTPPTPHPLPEAAADRAGDGAGGDRVDRPGAASATAPLPRHGPHVTPIVVAGGVVAGAAIVGAVTVAAPALLEGGSLAEGLAAGAGVAVRGRTFAATAARELVREYRAAAATFVKPATYARPENLGRALGTQAWAATTDIARSSIVGGGVAAGAWAFERAAHAVNALVHHSPAQNDAR